MYDTTDLGDMLPVKEKIIKPMILTEKVQITRIDT